MLENRNLKLDLLALALLAAVIFLAAALFSYDPADPPSKLVYPPHGQPVNMCGHSGAIAARLLFEGLGLGAYYLLVSVAAFDCVLLVRHQLNQFWLRAGGWLLSLAGVTTLAAMAVPGLSPGPAIGAGGYLGAIGRAILEMHFASLGAYILTVSMIFGGLLLSTDYWLIRLTTWIVGKSPMVSAAASCTSVRPTPKSWASGGPTSTISRATKPAKSCQSACLAGPPTSKTTRSRDEKRTKRTRRRKHPTARRPWDLASASVGQRPKRRRRCSRNWTSRTWARNRPTTNCRRSICY